MSSVEMMENNLPVWMARELEDIGILPAMLTPIKLVPNFERRTDTKARKPNFDEYGEPEF